MVQFVWVKRVNDQKLNDIRENEYLKKIFEQFKNYEEEESKAKKATNSGRPHSYRDGIIKMLFNYKTIYGSIPDDVFSDTFKKNLSAIMELNGFAKFNQENHSYPMASTKAFLKFLNSYSDYDNANSNRKSYTYKAPIAINKKIVKHKKTRSKSKTNNLLPKIDYLEEEKKKTEIGVTGEKQVMLYEVNRLKDYPNLQDRITQRSNKSDSYGYDILSFEKDGTERHIEVKTTSTNISNQITFQMSEGERQHALECDNYWIYFVFFDGNQPVIYPFKNPIIRPEDEVRAVPIKYQVSFNIND